MKEQGRENVEKVKSFYQAIQAQDFAAAGGLLDANVEWTEGYPEGLWFGGTHRGANNVVREVIAPSFTHITDFRVEASQFFDVGEYVVVLGHLYGRAKNTGKELNVSCAHVYTMRDGKIARLFSYQDIAALREVFGQAEERRMAGSENIGIVKSFHRALQAKDFTAAGGLMDANIEWIEPEAEGLWFSGTHRGAGNVLREVIEPSFAHVTDFRVEADRYFDVGEYVLVLAHFGGRAKKTGKELNVPSAHVYTVRNGKIARFHAYQDVATLQEVLGPAEEQRMAA